MVGPQRPRQGVRIIGPPVAGTDYELVGGPEGDSGPRSEQAFTDLDTEIGRDAADAAELHRVRVRVVPLQTPVLTRGDGEVFPPRTERQREAPGDAPPVAHIEAVLPVAGGDRPLRQQVLSELGRQPEEECGHAVQLVVGRAERPAAAHPGGRRAESRRPRAEVEPAARPARATAHELGLEVVQRLLVQVHARAELVGVLHPREVGDHLVLVIGAVVRHVVVRDAEKRIVADVETRETSLEPLASVRAGDAKLRPHVPIDGGVLGVGALAHEAVVGVHQQRRPQDPGQTPADVVRLAEAQARAAHPRAAEPRPFDVGTEGGRRVHREVEDRVARERIDIARQHPVHL